MKITMVQPFATTRGQLYQRGREYEVDDAFGQSLVRTNTAAASDEAKPGRVVQDLTASSQLDHALTRSKEERERMDKAKQVVEVVPPKPAAVAIDKPKSVKV